MTRFSPPERHARDSRPAVKVPAPDTERDRPERDQQKFRRVAILASVPGLSRPS